MPVIVTKDWLFDTKEDRRFLNVKALKIPVIVQHYAPPNDNYSRVIPQGYLTPEYWGLWMGQCKRYAAFDVENKKWVWSNLTLDKLSVVSPVEFDRNEIKKKRKEDEESFDKALFELTKEENIPPEKWGSFVYPPQIRRIDPEPTALQRILVSRFWKDPTALVGASVGSGKTRVAIDIVNARALTKEYADSVRIILVVAPLGLHENWKREFTKWAQPLVTYSVSRFEPTDNFWSTLEREAEKRFESVGGVAILCTPQALSRKTLTKQFHEHNCIPTFIIIDEAHRFFRNPDNLAYHNVNSLRVNSHGIMGLTGTPTAKLEDYHSLESLMDSRLVWRNAPRIEYERLGDKEFFTSSGLHQRGWSYERGIKEYHSHRIQTGKIFLADKKFYMADALPGLEQEELGGFADSRMSFGQLFDQYPELVQDAHRLQLAQNPEPIKNDRALATTLLLRMQQLASTGEANQQLLAQFVEDFLEKDEPCVFWTLFHNPPAEELPQTVRYLLDIGPTGWLMGGMKEEERWSMIDGFQSGKLRFIVCQVEAAGVGLTLTRACKQLFLSIPFGYLTTTQCIGRLHRLGQDKDVTSYFAMTHPVACFARGIYDKRVELNEHIPDKFKFDLIRQSV